jgi:hypothetical protein
MSSAAVVVLLPARFCEAYFRLTHAEISVLNSFLVRTAGMFRGQPPVFIRVIGGQFLASKDY